MGWVVEPPSEILLRDVITERSRNSPISCFGGGVCHEKIMARLRLLLALSSAVSVSCASSPANIKVSYEEVVDHHISHLMPLFLSDELNHEWSPQLQSIEAVHTREHGDLTHQTYRLPWPLAPREVLLSCDRKNLGSENVHLSECHSVETEAVPVHKGAVRMTLSRTQWKIVALPGERTKLHLELEVPADEASGIPKPVINYCQLKSLKDSVHHFVKAAERLKLPPHPHFLKWQRTRAEIAAATATASASASAAQPTSSQLWGSLLRLLAEKPRVLASVLALLLLRIVAVAGLANWWRRRASSSSRPPAATTERDDDNDRIARDEDAASMRHAIAPAPTPPRPLPKAIRAHRRLLLHGGISII